MKKRSKPANNGAGIVGLDEWAKRKGLNYGTIVVDLERRTVIDVLDEATLSAACYRGGGVVFEVNPAAHDRYLRALRRSGTLKISRQV